MPVVAEVAAQLAKSGAGTCNQALEANAARCLDVATNTSASAWGFGSGFSKVNRIFTAINVGAESSNSISRVLGWAVDSRMRNAV
jgi:hypothetical protein